jgi:PIN domain nuclease of toxin-antitoxin system
MAALTLRIFVVSLLCALSALNSSSEPAQQQMEESISRIITIRCVRITSLGKTLRQKPPADRIIIAKARRTHLSETAWRSFMNSAG